MTETVRKRVLVIDDEELILRMLKRVLGKSHDVVCAASAKEALALFDAGERFDVVFTDMTMPDLGGPELFRMLQECHPAYASRVVFMSGGATNDDHAEFLDRVANPRLDKPFQVSALLEMVSAVG